MKRERQWDMFDVAIGTCELDDYLNQRYSESDLQSKFWVEPSDTMDELRPPEKGSKEQIVIPVQGPSITPPAPQAPVASEPLPTRPPWETAAANAPELPSRPSWEQPAETAPPAPTRPVARPVPVAPPTPAVAPPPQRPSAPPVAPVAAPSSWSPPAASVTPEPVKEAPAAPSPPSMEELLARFHQAAQAYEERSKDTEESSDE